MNVLSGTSERSQHRTFIAVPLPGELAHTIHHWLTSWRTLNLGVRWASEEQLHFTLAFLGDLSASAQGSVTEVCRQVAKRVQPFSLRLGALGMFPPHGEGRVLWLGLSQGDECMQRLQQVLAQRLQEAGIFLEAREFVPHLTLGRAKPGTRLQRSCLEQDTRDMQRLDVFVNEVWVMQSELTPNGARHTRVAQCPLGK